jgi:hypothetical protein
VFLGIEDADRFVEFPHDNPDGFQQVGIATDHYSTIEEVQMRSKGWWASICGPGAPTARRNTRSATGKRARRRKWILSSMGPAGCSRSKSKTPGAFGRSICGGSGRLARTSPKRAGSSSTVEKTGCLLTESSACHVEELLRRAAGAARLPNDGGSLRAVWAFLVGGIAIIPARGASGTVLSQKHR